MTANCCYFYCVSGAVEGYETHKAMVTATETAAAFNNTVNILRKTPYEIGPLVGFAFGSDLAVGAIVDS